ncbi:hypothetical protein SISNIDRAFT_486240 [Sistotremastrum niveocremeum HHB9708]|uniref:CBM1 domain-containing protein n=1 Tax=Sistotremastrum niveocremeum HHB9708 TaxID=1314777 RepID=A0A164TXR6_9AGAM|nr:hypothetical protein SISNIDRAFT_486240 [Sistotremastrum niveocremeum HHB9708]
MLAFSYLGVLAASLLYQAIGGTATPATTTSSPFSASTSLCCQTYDVFTNVFVPNTITLCTPLPTSSPSPTAPPPGFSPTVYDLCTRHCFGKPNGTPTPTTCPITCTSSTTYGTGPATTFAATTYTNPDVQGTGGGCSPTSSAGGAPPGQSHYGQCGGQGYKGPASCTAPYTCSAVSPTYYSQCL